MRAQRSLVGRGKSRERLWFRADEWMSVAIFAWLRSTLRLNKSKSNALRLRQADETHQTIVQPRYWNTMWSTWHCANIWRSKFTKNNHGTKRSPTRLIKKLPLLDCEALSNGSCDVECHQIIEMTYHFDLSICKGVCRPLLKHIACFCRIFTVLCICRVAERRFSRPISAHRLRYRPARDFRYDGDYQRDVSSFALRIRQQRPHCACHVAATDRRQ